MEIIKKKEKLKKKSLAETSDVCACEKIHECVCVHTLLYLYCCGDYVSNLKNEDIFVKMGHFVLSSLLYVNFRIVDKEQRWVKMHHNVPW